MAEITLDVRFKQKYDTSVNWANNNPVLLAGELGVESDTNKIKIGDGSAHWNNLDYIINYKGTTIVVLGENDE